MRLPTRKGEPLNEPRPHCEPRPQESGHSRRANSRSLAVAARHIAAIFALYVAPSYLFAGEANAPEPPPPGLLGEFEGQNVQDIDVRGAIRVTENTVLKLIRTRKGRPFEQKTWEEDWHRLDDSGFFLNIRTTEPIKVPGGVRLTIDLVEKASIAKIEFKGSKSAQGNKLKTVIKSQEGGRYDKGQVHLDRIAIEKHYQDQGYRSVKVDYKVEVVNSHKQRIGDKEVEVEDEVRIIFTVDEGSSVAVRKICFTGNHAFSQSELETVMQTKYRRFLRAGELKDDDLETDKKRIELHYMRHGYMDVQIQEVKVETGKGEAFNWFRKRKQLADVIINIVEGPQYFTGNVNIKGNVGVSQQELESVMKVKPGTVFSEQLAYDDRQKILDLYGERGRPFTKLEIETKLVTDPERTKATPNIYDVTFTIKEGSEVTVREIIPRGNNKTKDKVLIRQLELYPGERIDTTKLKIAIQRLKNLQYFEDDIRVTPEATDNPEEANVIIDVTEKSTGEFNFGAGVSSVDGVVGNVSVKEKNFDIMNWPKSYKDLFNGMAFRGAGQTASADVSVGQKRQNYQLSLFEPWAFDKPIRLGGTLFHTLDDYQDFKDSESGASFTVGRRLWGPRWDGDITFRSSYTDIGSTDRRLPPILLDQDGISIVNTITPRIIYDSRDSLLLPSRGWFMQAQAGIGLGDYNFIRPSADIAHYLTVYKLKNGGKHIFSLHAHGELVQEMLGSSDVPPFLRLYGGGIDSVRGFEYRSITPLEKGLAIGAKREYYGSAEYSIPLYEELVRGAVFYDAGTAYGAGNTDPHFRVTNDTSRLRTAAGLGFYIRTPFSPAPVRLYFSRAIEKTPFDRTKTIDFTLGARF
ncbi:MAG TPA: outer membrane protein assembly factor BamA [Planctomycetota bacterium]|nr:outer membrane protein assembly factor BamA [Planctomycetota bacterium]